MERDRRLLYSGAGEEEVIKFVGGLIAAIIGASLVLAFLFWVSSKFE